MKGGAPLLWIGLAVFASQLPADEAQALSGTVAVTPVTAPTTTATASVTPAVNATAAESSEAYAARCSGGLDAELGLLDGGTLTQALRRLALQGAPLRVLLDPSALETRREGEALLALTPSVQVRWSGKAAHPFRRLLGAQKEQLLWKAGSEPSRADAVWDFASKRFEAAWAAATPDLPEALRLEDELRRLPDPTESQPHFIRRKEGASREADHEDDQDP